MQNSLKTSIFIFRRDFRLNDNIGLINCYKNSDKIIPIFNFTPQQIDSDQNEYKSDNCVQFMIESLKELDNMLENNLNLVYGDYTEVLREISEKYQVQQIYTNSDYTPFAIKRDTDILQFCKEKNIEFKVYDDHLLFKPNQIKNGSGNIFQKFTPFYNACLAQSKRIPKSQKLDQIEDEKLIKLEKKTIKSVIDFEHTNTFYQNNNNIAFHGGRQRALDILENIKNLSNYNESRNEMYNEHGTTGLSAYIKFGVVSVREVYEVFKANNADLARQVFWREFYYQLQIGFIENFGNSIKSKYDNIVWENNEEYFEKWKEGKTGYPIVDACMKQLNNTGNMHNRGRMIVASFLIKNLGVDWRIGEKYFATKLIDYDPIINQNNWQWVSGSGADSQQYIRVFNPWLQAQKFDPNAQFIKKHLPNLKNIPKVHLLQWDSYYEYHNLKNIKYCKPIIDYAKSKKKVLKWYKKGLYEDDNEE